MTTKHTSSIVHEYMCINERISMKRCLTCRDVVDTMCLVVMLMTTKDTSKIKELKHKHNNKPKEYDQYENEYLKNMCLYTLGVPVYKDL